MTIERHAPDMGFSGGGAPKKNYWEVGKNHRKKDSVFPVQISFQIISFTEPLTHVVSGISSSIYLVCKNNTK